jgi:hypothetical membrane protein
MSIQRTQRVLLSLGAAGPVIFIAVYLADGAAQSGYSSWHDTISTLSLAPAGWIQAASFMLYGVLTLCFAEGLRRSGAITGRQYAFLVIAGLGLLVIGPFRTDPVLGYPAGRAATATAAGTVHDLTSLVVFLAFPAAVFVRPWRPLRGWAGYSLATGVLSLAVIAAYMAAVTAAKGHAGGDSPAGLLERIPTVLIGLWQVAMAVRVLTRGRLSVS